MRKIETFNPATGERIAELEVTTSKEIQAMVGKAKKAQITWAEKSIRDRANIIIKAYEEVKNRSKQMADLIHNEILFAIKKIIYKTNTILFIKV